VSIAIELEEIRVRSLDVDFHELTWKVATTNEDLFDYTFQILRSEGPEGPFDAISPEMSDQYIYIDNFILAFDAYRQLYYKIRVKNKQTGETKEVGPVAKGPQADLVAQELRKHMNLLFREFIGRRCWVFPVRTFGQRCANCWDDSLQKRTVSGCLSCYETGFSFGYLRPIEAWISFDPSPKAEQHTSVGPLQQTDTTARMGYWPPLRPKDLIIEPENLRWRVATVTTTQQVRVPVHQEVGLHRIPSSDIEYRIEFETEQALRDMWLSPARNQTNPHSIDSFKDEEFHKVTQLYFNNNPLVRV
jgi:hypothetical protein